MCIILAPNQYTENETIARYEIMDGAPVRGESIPIRLFLSGYELTPSMKDINKKFSVRYFLNLVLVDEEERRYFKQQVCLISKSNLIIVFFHSLLNSLDFSVCRKIFCLNDAND